MRQDDEEPEADELEAIEPVDDGDDPLVAEFEMADEGEEAEPRSRSATMPFISGVLLGALVGAGIALLLTPARGAVLRKRLRKFARKVRARAGERFEALAEDAGRQLARRRRKIRQRLRERA